MRQEVERLRESPCVHPVRPTDNRPERSAIGNQESEDGRQETGDGGSGRSPGSPSGGGELGGQKKSAEANAYDLAVSRGETGKRETFRTRLSKNPDEPRYGIKRRGREYIDIGHPDPYSDGPRIVEGRYRDSPRE